MIDSETKKPANAGERDGYRSTLPEPEWVATPVRRWTTVFYHVLWSKIPAEDLAKGVIIAGTVLEAPPAPELYFEPPVIDLIKSRLKLSEFDVSTSFGKRVRIAPYVQLFPLNVAVLCLRCEPVGQTQWNLLELLRFNENYRYTRVRKWQVAQSRYQLTPHHPETGAAESPLHMGELLAAIADRYTLKPSETVYQTLGKMYVASFAQLDEPLSQADRYHLVFVDNPPDTRDTSPDPLPSTTFFEDTLKATLYTRWRHQGQYFAFTGHSFVNWLEPSPESGLPPNAVAAYWERTYLTIVLVLLFHRAVLTVLSRRAASIEEAYPHEHPKLWHEVKDLRRDLLTFTNGPWSDRITYEIQGSELVDLGRRNLGLDGLYATAREKLSEFYDYILSIQQQRINESLLGLQYVVLFAALFGLAVALFQLEGVRKIGWDTAAFWLGPWFAAQLPLLGGAIAGLLILFGLICIGKLIIQRSRT